MEENIYAENNSENVAVWHLCHCLYCEKAHPWTNFLLVPTHISLVPVSLPLVPGSTTFAQWYHPSGTMVALPCHPLPEKCGKLRKVFCAVKAFSLVWNNNIPLSTVVKFAKSNGCLWSSFSSNTFITVTNFRTSKLRRRTIIGTTIFQLWLIILRVYFFDWNKSKLRQIAMCFGPGSFWA